MGVVVEAGGERERDRNRDRAVSRALKRFRAFYAHGFDDDDYLALERSYKERAAREWQTLLSEQELGRLIANGEQVEVARRAVRIEGRTNLLFSFEKMALRDAVKSRRGAQQFAEALYVLLHGDESFDERFSFWIDALGHLPRKQTRVLTWPVATVFPFIAQPKKHLYLKPNVTKNAAKRWGFDFRYHSRPTVDTYKSLLAFGKDIRATLASVGFPGAIRDQIDVQGFIWILGSDEYD
jgi:hypothetical protein